MNRILLTTFLIACCSVANAQWEHLAELRVPSLLPLSFTRTSCAGQSVCGYNIENETFLSTDQGQTFKPFPFSGLPFQPNTSDPWLYMFPDYHVTPNGNQLYRLLPNAQAWEPLGTPFDTTPDSYFQVVARQGEKFIVSGTSYVVDTITWEYTTIYKEFRSFDEGNTWMPNETGLPGFGFSWSTVLDSVVLAQNGARDSTYCSTDGGANWQAVAYPPGLCHALNIRNRTGSNLLAQDTCQQLFFSADGGKSWVLTSGLDSAPFSMYDGLFYGILFQSGGNVIIISDSLYRSNDQGATWTSIPLNLYDSFINGVPHQIAATPNGTLLYWAHPELYASTDAGDTWTKVLDAPKLELELCECPPNLQMTDSLVYLMGDGGFYVSTDYGLTWTDRTQNSPHMVVSIDGLSANGPLLVARRRNYGCNTYVSPDSGATWRKSPVCNLSFARNTTQGIFALTKYTSIIYEGEGPFTLFKSTDEGASWKGVTLESEGQLDFLQPAGDKLLVMGPAIQVADPARLMVSALQGETWTLSSDGIDPGTYLSCAAYDSVTGKIYTTTRIQNPNFPGGIYISSDQGQTWALSSPDVRAASIVAENGHVCAMGAGKVWVSHDSGNTWATIADPVLAGNGAAENALVLADGNLVMGGNNVFISRDWGETWATFNEGLPPGTRALDLVRDDQYLYTASEALGIFRRPLSDLTTGTPPEATAAMALEVFPNPSANGLFNVKTGSAGERPVQLSVMDASGKNIWRGVLSGGRQTVNLSAAPPGVYWLRAVSDKETAVRKLVKAGG